MFFLTYLRRELLRRMRQAVVIALGLAIGVGLVITVVAATDGVHRAQTAVLHALYGIGTDMTVTKPPPAHSGAGHMFSPGPAAQHEDLLLPSQGLGLLDASSAATIARLSGVASAAGGLALTETKLNIPAASSAKSGLTIPTTIGIDGVDLTQPGLGPYGSTEVSAGRGFTRADSASNVVVVDSVYAASHKLHAGSAVVISRVPFRVIGMVRQPQTGTGASLYIPLARAQALASYQKLKSLTGRVDTIYVKATSSAALSSVQLKISALFPKATVTSSSSLANAVNGSLSSAARLATQLGRWLAIASLVAAFAVASLLTMAAVNRRVRELGTLKAIGWRSRRVVGQLMGESLVTGIIGAVLGIGVGLGGALLVRQLAPTLSASVTPSPGSAAPKVATISGGGVNAGVAPGSIHTVAVHLPAPVTISAILLAVVLATAGGLIAGSFASWRAARLRPADALGRVA